MVAQAYGWPANLSHKEILARLVALNKERAAEEAAGRVRWLRPEYQIPRFGTSTQKRQLKAELVTTAAVAPKAAFPTAEVEQTAAVMAALASAPRPLDVPALAASFRQGRRIEGKIAAVLGALARMGFVSTADGGRTFLLRRAA